MSQTTEAKPNGVAFGLLITALGGLLFTLDLPLLRLAGADKWSMVFARGVMLFAAITVTWFVVQKLRGTRMPFIAGTAGLAVIGTNTIANIAYIGSITETHAANAVQVFGSYGFSDEYPVERFYRNSKGASIYEGTREIHTLVQADYVLGVRKDKELERDLPVVGQ